MEIRCPHCGSRDVQEFVFRRLVEEAGDSAFAAVYERTNASDDSREYWQHVLGCRVWLVVRRNPSTDEVRDVRLLAASV
jgi:methylglutamate dehydrogenase subunit B